MKFHRIVRTLGTIFKIFSSFLLLPLAGSLFWDEDVGPSAISSLVPWELKTTTATFALVAIFVFLLGLLLTTVAPRVHEDLREREAFFIVGTGWLFCAVLGALPFLLAGTTQSITVALFESMSAITTTGFTALTLPLEDYPESIHLWRGALMFFGGVGIVLVAVAVIGRLVEGGATRLMGLEASAGDLTRLRPTLGQTAKTLFLIYLGLNVILFLALWWAIRQTVPGMGWKSAGYHALVHAPGSIATGGMSTLSTSVEGFGSSWVTGIVGVGMFLGSISFALYFAVLRRADLTFLFRSSEFRMFLAVIALGALAVSSLLVIDGRHWAYALVFGPWTTVATIATAGYTATNVDAFPDGAKLILMFLMITGAMVGSTAGGIKISRIQTLFALTFGELRKLLHPHALSIVKLGGRVLPEDTTRRIVVFFFTYVTVFIAGALAFSGIGFDLESSLSASAACLSNAGYGFGIAWNGFMEPVSDIGRIVGVLLMWLGRLEIFTVLLLFVPATYKS